MEWYQFFDLGTTVGACTFIATILLTMLAVVFSVRKAIKLLNHM